MHVGVFHPVLNLCGGGELVALNVVNSLRKRGHEVSVLTDERIDQQKFVRIFGQRLIADNVIAFPFRVFRRGDPLNIYTDALRCLMLKSRCEIVIDTFTNAILPGTDVVYIHYPFFRLVASPQKTIPRLETKAYFFPYRVYERRVRRNVGRLVFSNSKFTRNAIKETVGIQASVLYPPVSSFFLRDKERILEYLRKDYVVTVSRIAPEKNLEIIPRIAKLVHNSKFLIIGSRQDERTYSKLSNTIKELHVTERVAVLTNVSRTQLREILRSSKVYLHTAVNEHFGISIVEAMASGCMPVVHNSGGPREFVPQTLRYESAEEAGTKIEKVLSEWSSKRSQEMRMTAANFSEENFSKNFLNALSSTGLLNDAPCDLFNSDVGEARV